MNRFDILSTELFLCACGCFMFLYEPYVNELDDLVAINAYISAVWDKIEALKNGL